MTHKSRWQITIRDPITLCLTFNMRKEEYVDWLNSVDKEDRTDLMELEIADEMEYVFF